MSSYKKDSNSNSKSIEAKKENNPLSDNNNAHQSNFYQKIHHDYTDISYIPLICNQSRTQSRKTITGDRFIPQRPNQKEEQMNYYLIKHSEKDGLNAKNHLQYSSEINNNNNQYALNAMILDALSYNNRDIIPVDLNSIRKIKNHRDRILSYNSKPSISSNTVSKNGIQQNLLNQVNTIIEKEYINNQQIQNEERSMRKIPATPFIILDAPNLIDDYYLNLLDWGKRNIIAVGLRNYVYLWNSETTKTATLCTDKENICSVKWMENGTCLAVGLNDGTCDLYDVEKMSLIRKMDGHTNRVSCLEWNSYSLTSGSKDAAIINHDVRVSNHITSMLHSHSKEVCSLKWSLDGKLLASGGNDNTIAIWDINKAQEKIDLLHMSIEEEEGLFTSLNQNVSPVFKFNYHKAAVRALAWCPFQRHVLASGGGVKDQSIKLWNCDAGILNKSIFTGSQVCSLIWNPHERELISSHGYSKNQIVIWNYSKMSRISELTAHMNRVLYLSLSPDGCSLVSGSGDQSLCFWSINDEKEFNNINSNDTLYKQNITTQSELNRINLR